jgi:hypothetical protein
MGGSKETVAQQIVVFAVITDLRWLIKGRGVGISSHLNHLVIVDYAVSVS